MVEGSAKPFCLVLAALEDSFTPALARWEREWIAAPPHSEVAQVPPVDRSRGSTFVAKVAIWIAEARSGDGEALGNVLEAYRRYLYQIATDELPKHPVASLSPSDLVQETLLRATEKFQDFRGATAVEFVAWLRETLHHKLIDASRWSIRAKRNIERTMDGQEFPWASAVASEPSPSSAARRNEEADTVRLAVAGLREDFRTVIELRNFDGLTFEEVGARMNRSADAARKLWWRAVEELADRIEP